MERKVTYKDKIATIMELLDVMEKAQDSHLEVLKAILEDVKEHHYRRLFEGRDVLEEDTKKGDKPHGN